MLRNNKESGPYTLEEMKGISLKAYDLIWVVGKSAAWRYPGEITELKPFAPPAPEQVTDIYRKPNLTNKEEPAPPKKDKKDPGQSVYINLPSEKNQTAGNTAFTGNDSIFPSVERPEPHYDFSDLYNRPASRASQLSGKLLWIGSILLLFGTGIVTGLFISDRGKIFSGDANHPQQDPLNQPAIRHEKKVIPAVSANETQKNPTQNNLAAAADSSKKPDPSALKPGVIVRKKNSKNIHDKKDSVSNLASVVPASHTKDSVNQIVVSQTEIRNQKIKAHPENYIDLVAGKYTKGIFGGISSFPVTVTNNSPVKMDLVVVSVDYIQNNEKIFKTENISFNDLEPNETVTIKAPKSSRGVKTTTRIRVINSRQIDLSYSN